MDVTPIRNDSYGEGRLFQETLPYISSPKKKSLFINGKTEKDSDALQAVKLDPAVLEAHINNDSAKYLHGRSNAVHKDSEVAESRRANFEKAMRMERAALMSLSGQRLNLLMRYVDTLREQRQSAQKQLECGFCKKNGQSELWYTTHVLKDFKGRVRCPVLRAYTCRRCGATGDNAHTFKYCPITTL